MKINKTKAKGSPIASDKGDFLFDSANVPDFCKRFDIFFPSDIWGVVARKVYRCVQIFLRSGELRPTLMHTKNLYEDGPNPFFSGFFDLMGTRMVQIRMAKSV